MNILVTGANGQLGNELRIVAKGSQDKYIFTDVTEASDESINMLRKLAGEDVRTDTVRLDITDLEAVLKMVSEQEVQIAMREVDGLLVHISTDYVFGAEPYNTPCTEEQQVTPTGVYGQTKLHGEQAIIRTGCKHVIIRTAWLYSEFGKNFVKTMLSLTTTKPQLKVVFDQVGTPTYAYDLAQAIMVVLDDFKDAIIHGVALNYEKTGIYHFSNEGVTSWYDFTKLIAELAGNTACNIQPCHSDEFPSPVKRPAYSVLDKTKIKEVFGIKVPYWTDSLKKCLSTML